MNSTIADRADTKVQATGPIAIQGDGGSKSATFAVSHCGDRTKTVALGKKAARVHSNS